MSVAAKDCLTCGLCCVNLSAPTQPDFCNVTESDMKRLGAKFVRLHVLQPSMFDTLALALDGRTTPAAIKTKERVIRRGPFKGITVNACSMLAGEVMHKVSCKIYENRPTVCRKAVKPGDRTCLWLREQSQAAAASV